MADSDGKVVFDVVYNTENLNNQLDDVKNQANKKLGKIGSAASSFAKISTAAFAAVGTAAVAMGTKAMLGAVDIDKAMNTISASTGIAVDQLDGYEDTLKSIYANNYGDSFEDIGGAISTVVQQMGELDQASLQSITESAFALRDTFGYDVAESVRAANTMMTQFGIDGETAMGLIAKGAQNGLDFSGELLDSISEYSVQFAKVGLSADDMFKIMEKGAETGAFNLDKVGDAVKEMATRVVDGSATTAEGFAAIGLDADEMAAKFAAGGDTAREAFSQTISALAAMDDPLQQNIAGTNLFGTMWEDLGPDVVTQLASIGDEAYATADDMEALKAVKYDDLSSMLEGLGRTMEVLLIPLGESLIPLLSEIVNSLLPVLEEILPPLTDTVGELLAQLLPVVEQILPLITEFLPQILDPLMQVVTAVLPVFKDILGALLPPLIEISEAILPLLVDVLSALAPPFLDLINTLLPPFKALLEAIGPLIEALSPVVEFLAGVLGNTLAQSLGTIGPIVSSVMQIFSGLIEFITNVFSGNWSQAWNGIISAFKGIFNGIVSFAGNILNGAIDVINKGLKGIGKITSIVGIDIPTIPHISIPKFHAGGVVDFDATGEGLALLKDGEMVLTQQQQAQLFAAANGDNSGLNRQPIIVETPVYLDGKLISKNSTQHQYTDTKIKRLK